MAGDAEDPDTAADRLEAALERIAQAVDRATPATEEPPPSVHTEEIAARLDVLIHRLRTVLGGRAD
jgi:hypothetical protein